MSDYIITERSNIVAIADAVREKNGTTETLTLGEIVEGINNIDGKTEIPEDYIVDEEIAAQDDLIAQIATALEGKSIPGSGSDSGSSSVETYSGTISDTLGGSALSIYYTDANMIVQETTKASGVNSIDLEVAKNTIVFISGASCNADSGCVKLGGGTGSYAYQITDDNFVLSLGLM